MSPYVIAGLTLMLALISIIWKFSYSMIKELKENQKEYRQSTEESTKQMLVIVTELQTASSQHSKDIKEIKKQLKG